MKHYISAEALHHRAAACRKTILAILPIEDEFRIMLTCISVRRRIPARDHVKTDKTYVIRTQLFDGDSRAVTYFPNYLFDNWIHSIQLLIINRNHFDNTLPFPI